MVKLAKAYDRLAKSLRNFGGAIKGMDGEKLKQFRGMTSNIAVLSALDSKMFDNMLTVLESRSSVFAKMLNAQAPAPTGRSNVELKKKESTNNATFDNANKLVSLAEGGYTDNPIDAGNWTNGPDSKSRHLIGTNRGIAAFTIIKTNTN